jgi:cytochrome c5
MKNIFVVGIGCIFLFLFTATSVFAQQAAKAIVDTACSKCHNTKRIYAANKDAAAWETTLDRMMKKGAAIKPAEKDAVLNYLKSLNK